jgi:hypothetical protein
MSRSYERSTGATPKGGAGWVELADALALKYPHAGREGAWR